MIALEDFLQHRLHYIAPPRRGKGGAGNVFGQLLLKPGRGIPMKPTVKDFSHQLSGRP